MRRPTFVLIHIGCAATSTAAAAAAAPAADRRDVADPSSRDRCAEGGDFCDEVQLLRDQERSHRLQRTHPSRHRGYRQPRGGLEYLIQRCHRSSGSRGSKVVLDQVYSASETDAAATNIANRASTEHVDTLGISLWGQAAISSGKWMMWA